MEKITNTKQGWELPNYDYSGLKSPEEAWFDTQVEHFGVEKTKAMYTNPEAFMHDNPQNNHPIFFKDPSNHLFES